MGTEFRRDTNDRSHVAANGNRFYIAKSFSFIYLHATDIHLYIAGALYLERSHLYTCNRVAVKPYLFLFAQKGNLNLRMSLCIESNIHFATFFCSEVEAYYRSRIVPVAQLATLVVNEGFSLWSCCYIPVTRQSNRTPFLRNRRQRQERDCNK